MANRTFPDVIGSLDRSVRSLFGSMTMDTTGSIFSQDCNGFSILQVASLAGSASLSGSYFLQCDDVYPQSPATYVTAAIGTSGAWVSNNSSTSPLLGVHATFKFAGVRQFLHTTVVSSSVHTDGKIMVTFDSGSNSPANPSSGSQVYFRIDLRNSSTPRKGV